MVCNLRLRGILVGTKSIDACRAATGRNGDDVNWDSLSRNADAESVVVDAVGNERARSIVEVVADN